MTRRLSLLLSLLASCVTLQPLAAQVPTTHFRLTAFAKDSSADSLHWFSRLQRDSVKDLRRFGREFYFTGPVTWIADSAPVFLRDGAVLDLEPIGVLRPVRDSGGSPESTTSHGIHDVQADSACLGYHVCGQGTKFADIDMGTNPHPDLLPITGKWFGVFPAADTGWEDDNSGCDGHGTHTAGTVGGALQGTAMGVGIAPLTERHAFRVTTPTGPCTAYGSALTAALNEAATEHLDAVNISLGFSIGTQFPAVTAASAAGVAVVAAAGNSGGAVESPASMPAAFAVGSWSGSGLSGFSSRPPLLSAPGQGIVSTCSSGGYCAKDGTSMAAPHVTGLVLLIKTIAPHILPDSLKKLLCIDAIPVANGGCGVPQMMHIIRAMIAAGQPTTAAIAPAGCQHDTLCTGSFDVDQVRSFDVCVTLETGGLCGVSWITTQITNRTVTWTATPPLSAVGQTPLFTIRGT